MDDNRHEKTGRQKIYIPGDEVRRFPNRDRGSPKTGGSDRFQHQVFQGEERTVIGVEGEISPTLEVQLGTMLGVQDVVGSGKPDLLETRDLRVPNIRPLISPTILREQLPLSGTALRTVSRSREEVIRVLNGEDDRLVVVVGPCSIHDPTAARDYAHRL